MHEMQEELLGMGMGQIHRKYEDLRSHEICCSFYMYLSIEPWMMAGKLCHS